MQTVRCEYIKTAITDSRWDVKDEEMLKAIDYVKKNGLDMYCGGIDGVCTYSEKSDINAVSVDDFCRENSLNKIDFIKMDVEGAEKDVLSGVERMIQGGNIKKLAVCTYHKLHDEEILGEMLTNYRKTWSEGYMLGTAL